MMKRYKTNVIKLIALVFFIGSFNSVFADSQLTDAFTIVGHYDLVANGVSMQGETSGDIILDVPGTPRAAYLYWAGFALENQEDNSVQLTVDGGLPVTLVADEKYGPDPWWTVDEKTFHLVYRKDITSLVRQGNHLYQISDFGPIRYHYGAGIVVVYEDAALPVQQIKLYDGLDAGYFRYNPPRGPNSRVTFIPILPGTDNRIADFMLFVGGIHGEERPNAIWWKTRHDTADYNIIEDPIAHEIGGNPPPLGGPNEEEWDTYFDSVTIPPDSDIVQFQIESVSDIPNLIGASFCWIALGLAVPVPDMGTASVGDFVWEDSNRNGIQDAGERGIENVRVDLCDANSDHLVSTDYTNTNGFYLFTDVASGQYYIKFHLPENFYFTAKDEGGDDGADSDALPSTGKTDPFVINTGEHTTMWDCGMIPKIVSDLEIIKESNKEYAKIGEEIVFTLTVINHGPDDATAVQIMDDLPAGLEFMAAVPPIDMGPNPLIWTLDLAAGESQTIQIITKTTDVLGGMDNNAFISSENRDPSMNNNASSAQIHTLVPIELSSLSATFQEEQMVIEWATQTETNNYGFEIYRAEYEEGPYTKITTKPILGAGDSESTKSYRFIDHAPIQPGQTFYYKLADIDYKGQIHMHGPVQACGKKPTSYKLEQNYPNPFNPQTTLKFNLKHAGLVELDIFNVNGQLIKTLLNKDMRAGQHMVVWNGRDEYGQRVPTGVYFYRLTVNDFIDVRKMLLIK